MSEYTDDDLGLLAEHVDHLQRRVNRLLHSYHGSHDQKKHGNRGAGTGKRSGGLFGGAGGSAGIARERKKATRAAALVGKRRQSGKASPGVFTKAGRGSIVSDTRAALARVRKSRSGADAGNAKNRKRALALVRAARRSKGKGRRGALSRLGSSLRGIGIGASRVARGKRN